MKFTTTTETVIDFAGAASHWRLTARNFGLMLYRAPTLRPPVLDEMMPDCERLIHSVAQRYCDQSSPHLQFDEMVGEGRLKLAELIDAGHETRQPTRSHFFAFFKASLTNLARSRVQKYRFTEKRTGVKPPPRHARLASFSAAESAHHKQVDLSLDDTDLHLQVADSSEDEREFQEIAEDYEQLLSEPEKLVYRQLICPNELARAEAYVDAHYLRLPGSFVVKIKHIHLAKGLQMSLSLFTEAVLSIKQKITAYRAMSESEQLERARENAILQQLKTVFGVQIPPTADTMLVRRLFTIAARDQYQKINSQVAEMLEAIGAKVPRVHKDMIGCYGVLYTAWHRACQSCGLKRSCAVEAANLGLHKITLSPQLLGSRQTRSPVVLPEMGEPALGAADYNEAEVLSYLDEFFTRFKRGDSVYYGDGTEAQERQVLLFCLGTQTSPLVIRFCSPSEKLKKKLVMRGKGFFAPDNASTQTVTALLDEHAKDILNG
jgi:hypothetical protein